MSRRPVNPSRRLADGGSIPFVASIQSKSRNSPVLSIGLVVVVNLVEMCISLQKCSGVITFMCNIVPVRCIVFASNRSYICGHFLLDLPPFLNHYMVFSIYFMQYICHCLLSTQCISNKWYLQIFRVQSFWLVIVIAVQVCN